MSLETWIDHQECVITPYQLLNQIFLGKLLSLGILGRAKELKPCLHPLETTS